MSLIANLKNAFFQRRLLREIDLRKPDYQPRAVNPATAKYVAVLFPADSADDRKLLEEYRRQRKLDGLRTEVLGYFTADVGSATFGIDHFSAKELNWYGAPQGSAVEKFLSRPCDLLITLGPAGHRQLDYLAALKKAGLRVGPYTESPENPYDVMFSTRRKAAGLKDQLNQIERIFKVTNATATAAV